MAVSESKMAEFKMAAIIKLSQNEQVKFFFGQIAETGLGKSEWVVQNGWIQDGRNARWPELKMVAIIKLSEIELVWFRLN